MKPAPETRLFKTLAEQLSEAIVVTDREGRVTWSNQAFHELCGYSREEVRGRKPGALLQGEATDPETAGALRDAVRREERVRVEILNYHKNGNPYWAQIGISPIEDADGRTVGFVAIERDITESVKDRRRLEENVVEVYQTLLSAIEEDRAAEERPAR